MQTETAYFTRAIHGGHRVRRLAAGALEVQWPSGSIQYPSIKRTLIAVVSKQPVPDKAARDPKMGFDRYFRVTTAQESTSDTLQLFSPLLAMPERKRVLKTTDAISISGSSTPLGIDLVRRGHEVAKDGDRHGCLLFAETAAFCATAMLTPAREAGGERGVSRAGAVAAREGVGTTLRRRHE